MSLGNRTEAVVTAMVFELFSHRPK